MYPRFVTNRIRAFLDYPVAIVLIVLPFVLGLGQTMPLALWLSVVTGGAAFTLTVLTDHHLGVLPILSYKFHLAVDFIVGTAFVTVPFFLGFTGLGLLYYVANGAAVLIVATMHKPESADAIK
jgi:hypothetical protein